MVHLEVPDEDVRVLAEIARLVGVDGPEAAIAAVCADFLEQVRLYATLAKR